MVPSIKNRINQPVSDTCFEKTEVLFVVTWMRTEYAAFWSRDMLNYRHLYYFWVVGKEGGFTHAADRLGMAIQTISAQVRELERSLGHQLLKPAGRGVELTPAGRVAFERADAIFLLGQQLPHEVHRAATRPVLRFTVGLSDGISKLAAHALLGPVLHTTNLHLVCHEGEFDQLLAELALHHLDVILAGQPAPLNPNLRLQSDCLATSSIDWYGVHPLVTPEARQQFPACMAQLPVLLPTGHSELRVRLDHWFDVQGITPNVVGEFEDSALMSVFATGGMGVFPISQLGASDVDAQSALSWLGRTTEVSEEIHAIRNRRGNQHPLVRALLDHAMSLGRVSEPNPNPDPDPDPHPNLNPNHNA